MQWILHGCLFHPWDERLQNPICEIANPNKYTFLMTPPKSRRKVEMRQRWRKEICIWERPVKGRNSSEIYSSTFRLGKGGWPGNMSEENPKEMEKLGDSICFIKSSKHPKGHLAPRVFGSQSHSVHFMSNVTFLDQRSFRRSLWVTSRF